MRGKTERGKTECRSDRDGAGPAARADGERLALSPKPAAVLLIFICLPWLLGLGSRAFAEDAHVLVLPEIVIGGEKDKPTGSEHCTDAPPTAGKSMDCLNQTLKRQVDRVNPPTINQPPLDARSPDLKVGVINVPGVQQQYGKNFGVSAFPFRPPPAVFSMPGGGRR
jgi:hypothetical protein